MFPSTTHPRKPGGGGGTGTFSSNATTTTTTHSSLASHLVQAMGSKVVQAVGEKLKDSLEHHKKNNNNKKAGDPSPQELLEEAFADTTQLIIQQKLDALEVLTNVLTNCFGLGFLFGRVGEQTNTYHAFTRTSNNNNNHNRPRELVFRIVEESELVGWTGRCWMKPHHALRLHVYGVGSNNKNNNNTAGHDKELLQFDRPCKLGCCFSCCDCCRQEMNVLLLAADNDNHDGGGNVQTSNLQDNTLQQARQQQQQQLQGPIHPRRIAVIREPFLGGTGLSPSLQVMDRDGEHVMLTIQSQSACCIGGICCDHTFSVFEHTTTTTTTRDGNDNAANGTKQQYKHHPTKVVVVGTIVKHKPKTGDTQQVLSELISDMDTFSITVPTEMPAEQKAALLASLHLLDYSLFEGEGDCTVNVCQRSSIALKLCNIYCCGCVCPIGIRRHGKCCWCPMIY